MPKIVVDKELCKACELCAAVCPKKILELGHELNPKAATICARLTRKHV